MAQYCNRVFPIETVQDIIYPDRDPYPYQITGHVIGIAAVRAGQLSSVTSVTDTVTRSISPTRLIEGTDYIVDPARGWLTKIDPNTGYPTGWSPDQYTVEYVAGCFTPGTDEPAAPIWKWPFFGLSRLGSKLEAVIRI